MALTVLAPPLAALASLAALLSLARRTSSRCLAALVVSTWDVTTVISARGSTRSGTP